MKRTAFIILPLLLCSSAFGQSETDAEEPAASEEPDTSEPPALEPAPVTPATAPAMPVEPPKDPSPTREAVTLAGGAMSYDLRSRADDQIVMPAGMYTVGGTLTFLTAPESPFAADEELRFTDFVLLGVGARYGIKGRAEIAASITLVPK